MREIKMGKYRHFKGELYDVLCVAEHTETAEQMVIYRALYGENKLYVRPLTMFLSKTDKEKHPNSEQEFRFMNMDELENQFGLEDAREMVKL